FCNNRQWLAPKGPWEDAPLKNRLLRGHEKRSQNDCTILQDQKWLAQTLTAYHRLRQDLLLNTQEGLLCRLKPKIGPFFGFLCPFRRREGGFYEAKRGQAQ